MKPKKFGAGIEAGTLFPKPVEIAQKKWICAMCEAENESQLTVCKMCKHPLKWTEDEAHARRHRILMLISELWERHPEQRFGQLIVNYAWKGATTLFNYEDAELEANLKAQLKKEGVNYG